MVGDVAGFAAMVYMRGVRLVLVPTTLTSMADAAIGGKNACNLKGTKNMIGGFCLPDQTLIDISFLESLPEREEKSGAGELIKTQLLSGLPGFRYIPRQQGRGHTYGGGIQARYHRKGF